ncbi:hypothetical protein CLOLEP_02727 [[Clostridium] leptum DSM 753]|uniref:Uncharacterized protein n=1 Tax=[Clostridium] leptum DSM 753 TaxID=428125 RepID=A7VVW4_9FIRM|nr:hypothetical protein CLOLEP_02727 [[Clostridium] leptum DSM 753]
MLCQFFSVLKNEKVHTILLQTREKEILKTKTNKLRSVLSNG